MALSTAALGLLSTAALFSLYRIPGLWSPKNGNTGTNPPLYKRFTNSYLPQRQYLEPPPHPLSLDNLMNRLFRRPYLADVRPPQYRKPRPYRPLPSELAPIWHSLPQVPKPTLSLPTNSYYTYTQYGMPMVSKKYINPVSSMNINRPTNKPNELSDKPEPSSNQKEWSSEVDDRDDLDLNEEDDDYDDHYYTEDFNPLEGPFRDDSKETKEKTSGGEFYYKGRQEKQLNEARNESRSEEYLANPSKKTYAYSKGSKSPSTTPASTAQDCSTGPKVNYHYHMYLVKTTGAQKKKKTATKPRTTTVASVYPVYEAESRQKIHTSQQTFGSVTGGSGASVAFRSQVKIPNSVITFQKSSKDANSDYFYEVVTSSSYIEPSDSYVHMTSIDDNDNAKGQSKKPGSHFDSDYYNNVLLSKILGLNTNAKVMPLENYATESSGTAPLANFDYKNSKSISGESSKLFDYDDSSKLYITKSNNQEKKKTKKQSKAKN